MTATGLLRRAAAMAAGACLAAAAAAVPGGCSVTNLMATSNPGGTPRDGQLAEVAGVGGDQVQFTFRFKAGPDPANPAATVPVNAPAAIPAQITRSLLNDTRGFQFTVADQEVRNQENAYQVVLTSSPVRADTYEVVCQALVTLGGYVIKLTGSAYREVDGWRIAPRSFQFSVYRSGEQVPWYEKPRERWIH